MDYGKKMGDNCTKPFTNIFLLGTGGNINKLHKISNNNENKPLTYKKIKKNL